MHIQVPHRLFPDEHPSIARLVQLVLCDDEWARIDAYRVCSAPPPSTHRLRRLIPLQMAYEHVYGIRLGEYEAEAYIRQKVAIQQRLMLHPPRYASGLGLCMQFFYDV